MNGRQSVRMLRKCDCLMCTFPRSIMVQPTPSERVAIRRSRKYSHKGQRSGKHARRWLNIETRQYLRAAE